MKLVKMITFTELKYFGDQDPALKILKPWWDVFLEYLNFLMILISVFGGALQVSHEKTICIPVPQDVSTQERLWNLSMLEGLKLKEYASGIRAHLDLQQYHLINQWCYDNAILWYSKYLPYVVLLHSLVFVVTSNFWFTFPGTSSKIEHFVMVLGKCLDSPWTTKALSETVYGDSECMLSVCSTTTVDQAMVGPQQINSIVSGSAPSQHSSFDRSFCEKSVLLTKCSPRPSKSAAGLMMNSSSVRILDKKEGEQAKALFEKVRKFRLHVEEKDILYKMYMRQTIVRALQATVVLIYISVFVPEMKHIVHCTDKQHITGFTDFYCIHCLWRMFRMLSLVYLAVLFLYSCTCLYTLHWIFYYKLKEYSFENVRKETGIDDIPDVKNDFAFLLHLIDQYDKLYARKFAVFLSDVSETTLLQLNLNHEWTLEKLKQRLVTNSDNKLELHLFMLPGIPIHVYNLFEIEVLKLELIDNSTIVSSISNLKLLKELRLYNCSVKIESQGLTFLKENLITLNIRFSYEDEIPHWIYSLKSLRELYLEGRFHAEGKTSINLQSFREMQRLKSIYLKTYITKLPAAIFDTAGTLQRLTIHNGGLKITSFNNLKKLYHLTNLKILHCNLERIPSAIFSLSNLLELDLTDNNLRSTQELASCQQLRKLICIRLSQNKITTIPPHIVRIVQLEMLYLNKNNIPTLPPSLFKLTKLNRLDVSHNMISEIPPEVGQLVNLQYFATSHNNISELPKELFECTKLRVLQLSHNNISVLPPLIKELAHLCFLDLKGNKLEKLPLELGQCACLQKIQLLVEMEVYNTLPVEVRDQLENTSNIRNVSTPLGI
nr:PREDICTED: volume-regulated anion channel subunit LRRC8C-like [Latimeria chalumnae]|eukprot:XP_006006067.2 PREDICTED: volume-regulated anion channel subunit LRRC8C-like [Latimeria chalumnae]